MKKKLRGWWEALRAMFRRRDVYRDETSVTAQLQGEEIVEIGLTEPGFATIRLFPSGDLMTLRVIDRELHVERFDPENNRVCYTSTRRKISYKGP